MKPMFLWLFLYSCTFPRETHQLLYSAVVHDISPAFLLDFGRHCAHCNRQNVICIVFCRIYYFATCVMNAKYEAERGEKSLFCLFALKTRRFNNATLCIVRMRHAAAIVSIEFTRSRIRALRDDTIVHECILCMDREGNDKDLSKFWWARTRNWVQRGESSRMKWSEMLKRLWDNICRRPSLQNASRSWCLRTRPRAAYDPLCTKSPSRLPTRLFVVALSSFVIELPLALSEHVAHCCYLCSHPSRCSIDHSVARRCQLQCCWDVPLHSPMVDSAFICFYELWCFLRIRHISIHVAHRSRAHSRVSSCERQWRICNVCALMYKEDAIRVAHIKRMLFPRSYKIGYIESVHRAITASFLDWCWPSCAERCCLMKSKQEEIKAESITNVLLVNLPPFLSWIAYFIARNRRASWWELEFVSWSVHHKQPW